MVALGCRRNLRLLRCVFLGRTAISVVADQAGRATFQDYPLRVM
jgi:hypothetical protein